MASAQQQTGRPCPRCGVGVLKAANAEVCLDCECDRAGRAWTLQRRASTRKHHEDYPPRDGPPPAA
jgi:hypothetical protein